MKKKLLTLLMLAVAASVHAQKTVYIPYEWQHPWPADSLLYKESDPEGRYTWSKTRSVESDNVIVFWDKGYGQKKPSESPSAYRVDEQDLLQKCEAFYDLEINKLGFVSPTTSNLAKYKVMVLLNHTTDWVCYGGGYDFQISALWLGPSACKPVGHSVAHEVGHSFHYMCFAEHSGHQDSQSDGTGFHLPVGKGAGIWEQTAQWQANQSYPELMYDQSISMFRNTHHLAFTHEWHRYQSYWFLYYLCQHYGDITTVAQVWNQPMQGASDFNQALMKLKGLKVPDLYRLYYDYAARLATWDLDACQPYRQPYIGDFNYRCVAVNDNQSEGQGHTYQVALMSCPQTTGFNLVPLQVPAGGGAITAHFTALPSGSALAPGDPTDEWRWTVVGKNADGSDRYDVAIARSNKKKYNNNGIASQRGFRLGFVALMDDGTRRYFNEDSVYCTGNVESTAQLHLTVPAGTSRLWLVVSPAPKVYVQHKWDDNSDQGDYMWPYRLRLEGTDLDSRATVSVETVIDGRPVSDVTLTYDVWFPPTTGNNYQGTSVNVSGQASALLGTALQMQPADIAAKMQTWSSGGPAVGRIMFYACNPRTGARVNQGSTANGYGHWFNAQGSVSDWNSGYVYSEFTPATLTFNIGSYPGKTANGQTYTIQQALRYRQSATAEAMARFVFRIHTDSQHAVGAQLASIDYKDPTGIIPVSGDPQPIGGLYDLQGRRLTSKSAHAIYIEDGRKYRPQ
jgi:hypothetical protein